MKKTERAHLVSDDEEAERLSSTVGTGTPDTAPWELPAPPGWLQRQPILAFALMIVLTDLGAAITTISAGQANPLVLSALGVVGALVGFGALVVRQVVTPVALPRLDRETPLVPIPPDLPDHSEPRG